jgi:eukaryotic-like serine/threonine-protein kinase
MSLLPALLTRRPQSPPSDVPSVEVPTDEPAPLTPGAELLPGYRVLTHVDRGRVYDVYEVWSTVRHCSCVAKTTRPGAQEKESVRGELRREGELLASFTHPHLVRAYEVVDEPRLAVILETLEGQTLEHLIKVQRRRVPPAGLACLGLHLCSAIGYLHRHDLLHLDLKPANIISDAGRAKLIDLSLARPPGKTPRGMGTPSYLAPEQARGDEVSPATDVWGIGAVLYEAVTKDVPFEESKNQERYGQLERRASLTGRHRRRLPRTLAEAIDACLEPDPGARPALGQLEETLDAMT